jgi:hypothetical protein
MTLLQSKRSAGLLVACILLVLITGIAIYHNRLTIAARYWHWKNGDVVFIGDYQIPVFRNWLVSIDTPEIAVLVNTDRPSQSRSGFHTQVAASRTIEPMPDLNRWSSVQEDRLKALGAHTIETHLLRLDGEKVVCVGGKSLPTELHIAENLVSLHCRSTGSLDLTFIGDKSEVQAFIDMVTRIRKSNLSLRVDPNMPLHPADGRLR